MYVFSYVSTIFNEWKDKLYTIIITFNCIIVFDINAAILLAVLANKNTILRYFSYKILKTFISVNSSLFLNLTMQLKSNRL